MKTVLWHMIDHRFTKAHASVYLDGEIDPPGRERIERHTSVCPQCRMLLTSLRRMLRELSQLTPAPRPSVTDGVLDRLHRCA